MEHFRC